MTYVLHNSLVRILNTAGRPVGVGFLAAPQIILTCAHVVQQAAGEAAEVTFDFPLLAPGERRSGCVVLRDEEADVACLQPRTLPRGAVPARLVQSDDLWEHPFRAFGVPAGHDNGVWASGVLRDRTAQGWLHIEDTKETGFAIQPGFSGGPVWDDRLEGVAGMVVAAERSPQVKAAFCIPVTALVQALPALAERALPPNPYRGLRYFREQDAALFFGREAFTKQLLQAVEGRPLTAVVGASGAGKSSVVFAGLLPHLRARSEWRIASFRPADRPFEMLAAALLPLLEPGLSETDRLREIPKLAASLRTGEVVLADVANAILHQHPEAHTLLLVADQFEELYTLNESPNLRTRFVDCLLEALRPAGGLCLVLTMRADFLGQALEHRALSEALREAAEYLGPMTPDELRRAITGPAERAMVRFEPGLDDLIIEEVAAHPGALPLLEFALTQLWEWQENGYLTLKAYREIGGVEGALARYAETQYAALSPSEQQSARKVLVQLVAPGAGQEDTRRMARLRELPPALQSLVPRLADARLIVTDRTPQGEETLEVAHEALIRAWERLRTWMESDRAFRLWQERVRAQMRQWEESSRDPGALLRGAPLAQAEAHLEERAGEIEPALAAYIRRSRAQVETEQRERERLQQRIVRGVIGVALLLLMLAGMAFWQAREARRQRNLAQVRQMVAVGQAEFNRIAQGPFVGTLLGVEALERGGPSPEADQLVRRGLALLSAEVTRMIHEGGVTSVAFSPDGRYVVSDGWDNTMRVWEVPGGREMVRVSHKTVVLAMVFSPDGRYVASGECDEVQDILLCVAGTVRVWEATTGREVARMSHESGVYAVAFSPDGRYVLSGSQDGTARVWEAATGREVARMTHEGRVTSVAFSPDGRYVVSGSLDSTARVWEAATGHEVARMTHEGEVTAVAFSPDGRYVVSGSNDGTARVWEIATGREVAHVMHEGWRVAVAFSLNGRYVVSGSKDGIAHVWDAVTGREVARMRHGDWVVAVAFSPDGRYVLSGSWDGVAYVWEAATGREVARMTHDGPVDAVAFSPDGRYMISVSKNGIVHVWQAGIWSEAARMGYKSGIFAIAFGPNGRYVVSGGCDGRNTHSWCINGLACVWDAITKKNVSCVEHGGTVNAVAFSPDGHYVLSGSTDGTARVWEAASGHETARMSHESSVVAVAFSPDGRYVLSGSADGTARVWEAATGREVARMAHEGGVTAVAFSPDGRYVLSGSTDGTARVWEAASGREVARMTHEGRVTSVAFSPDGHYVLSGSADGTARVWDADTGREVARMTHDTRVTAVAFSPDGRYVASGVGRTVRVWEAATGHEVARMTHEGGVAAVAFSPDGRYVLSGSTDGTARVWEADTGREMARMSHDGLVYAVAFSPDGRYVLSGSTDGMMRVWLYRPQDLIEEACRRLPRNLTLDEWQKYVGPEIPYHATCPNLPVPER